MAFTQIGSNITGDGASHYFGRGVSLSSDGTVVAIGASNGNSTGYTQIYAWNSATSSWEKRGNNINGEGSRDFFGSAVSISSDGNTVAIGAKNNDGNGTRSGHVRIYNWNGSAWIKLGNDIQGEIAEDKSGTSISLSNDGSIVAIGAPQNDDNGNNSGHVRIYDWDGSSWVKLGDDIDGRSSFDFSGESVALSEDGHTVAIGSKNSDQNEEDTGHTSIYNWNGSAWIQLGSDIIGEAKNDHSGGSNNISISNDGKIVAIGAISNNGDTGHTRIYEWNGSSWSQLGSDIDGEDASDLSGRSVSLSANGEILAIGAMNNDGGGSDSGHVRIYQLVSGNWVKTGDDIDGLANNDKTGISVSLSEDGNTLAIGSGAASGGGNEYVRIFNLGLDVTAPAFSSAATSTDGNTVVLTYNEALDSTTAASSTFAVTTGGSANAVTGVAIDGSTVVLTLTDTVKNNQTVTVSYTDPSGANDANAIQDSSGNDAISISNKAVTNNSNVAGTGVNDSVVDVKKTDNEKVSSDISSSGDSNTVKTTNTPKDKDGDNDGAIDSFERSIDPDTQKPLDRNDDGIADHNQRTVASFASTSGKVSSLSSQNPVLNAAENTSQGSIQSKIALLFRGISAEAEQEAGPSIGNLQESINIIGANTNSQRYQAAGKTVIKTSDQPDFRLIPELIVEGNVPQEVINTHQSAANERFTNTIHRVDYRFEEDDNNWNALFKPDESGRLRLLGYDPITGLGGILTDRDGDGRADGATIFLKDNQKGDLNPDSFVIDDPVGAAELQSPPKLIATSDGQGLVVEGPEGLGLWVRLKTNTANADWQNGLQLISNKRNKIGAIGATRDNANLGITEIYLQSGEELRFRQSSNNLHEQTSPAITLKQSVLDENWNLCLEDGGKSLDGDYDDLRIIIDSHLTPQKLESVLIAKHQASLADGLLDLRDFDNDSIELELSINSNADHKNRIAFVLLDGRDNDQALSINGIESTSSKAFEAEVADSLINPGGDQLYLQGKTDTTVKWTLNNDQLGLYAPVIITENNELFTAGLSSRDGHSHLKLIGQNHFAFEDMTHSNNSDFDYNDVVIKVDTT